MLSAKLLIIFGRIPAALPAKTSKSGPWRLNNCLITASLQAAKLRLKRLRPAAKKLLLPAPKARPVLLKRTANNLVK